MHTPEIIIESLPETIDAEMIARLEKGIDFFLFSGDLDGGLDRPLIDWIQSKKKSDIICLILTTPGGSADSAYSIARKLNRLYKQFGVLVNGYCKSE